MYSSSHRLVPGGRRSLAGGRFGVGIAVAVVSISAWQTACAAEPSAIVPIVSDAPMSPAVVSGAPSNMTDLVDAAHRLHPTARAIVAAQRAADARISQAGVWANPEIEYSYGRTRPRVSDLDTDSPSELSVSQRLEWWGKRRARVAAAKADAIATNAQSDAAKLELDIEVRLAGISYAIASESEAQAAAQVILAQEFLEVVVKRQAAGDIALGEAARVKVDASMAQVRHAAAKRSVTTALAVLRTWCGESLPDGLVIVDALNDFEVVAAGSQATHPRLHAAKEAERAAEAHSEAERQARYPDVTLGVFGGREQEKDTLGFKIGIEVPLWDRNAAGIAAAEAERDRLAATSQLEALRVRRERSEATGVVESARAEILILINEALPAASDAVQLRGTAFSSGDASLVEVLDARRAWLLVQADLLDAKRRLAEAQVRLMAATAGTGSNP